ncbi:hypothetical protein FGO68_gene1031 [Halteria grandinella]|uniref:Uncharacterized protein n=1 Tax=Halteria grandinella TaxID=5974 RepID=A0A8J8NTC9_HALGN|nr:hypothetical protein FGO68_gene1031 [Halteria grandinella]
MWRQSDEFEHKQEAQEIASKVILNRRKLQKQIITGQIAKVTDALPMLQQSQPFKPNIKEKLNSSSGKGSPVYGNIASNVFSRNGSMRKFSLERESSIYSSNQTFKESYLRPRATENAMRSSLRNTFIKKSLFQKQTNSMKAKEQIITKELEIPAIQVSEKEHVQTTPVKCRKLYLPVPPKLVNLDLPWSAKQIQQQTLQLPTTSSPLPQQSTIMSNKVTKIELNKDLHRLLAQIDALKSFKNIQEVDSNIATCQTILRTKGRLIDLKMGAVLEQRQQERRRSIYSNPELSVHSLSSNRSHYQNCEEDTSSKILLSKVVPTSYASRLTSLAPISKTSLYPKKLQQYQSPLNTSQQYCTASKPTQHYRSLSQPRDNSRVKLVRLKLVTAPQGESSYMLSKRKIISHNNDLVQLAQQVDESQIGKNPYENLCIVPSGGQRLMEIY